MAFEYIKNAGLKPTKSQRNRAKTDLIVLHQVEGTMTPQQIHTYHISKGYSGGIAYNIYVGLDGSTYWGRGLGVEGGGVRNSGISAGVNARCVAIVCNGNFNKNQMSSAQLNSLKRVTLDVAQHYKLTADQIKGHREVGSTDCPGRYFPLSEVRSYVKQHLNKPTQPATFKTIKPTVIYKDIVSVSVGHDLFLESYTNGEEYALVKNSKTKKEMLIKFADLKPIPGRIGHYSVARKTNVIVKTKTIAAGKELILESYMSGNKFACVKNPETNNTFWLEYNNLTSK